MNLITKKNHWDEKFNSTCFPCLLPVAYSRAVEAQTQNTQKVAIALKSCVPAEIDKKTKVDNLATQNAKQQQLIKQRALQIANKQLWISQHPAEYQTMLNQLAVQQTLSKTAFNLMPTAKRNQILAQPKQYNIVD